MNRNERQGRPPKTWSGRHQTDSQLAISRYRPHLSAVCMKLSGSTSSCIKRLWTGATVKIPAVCLTSPRGGAELQAEREKQSQRKKEIRLKSERGKCSHSQGLWAPYIAANYLLSEVISFRTAARQLMRLAIKCPYFSLSREMPFLSACPQQSLPVLGAAKQVQHFSQRWCAAK